MPDYRASSATAARRQLTALATWLERNGQADAAASLREGLEETVTVLKLVLPPAPRRLFATTNCIENLIGTLRHVTRNIKRWPTATCAGGGSGSACCAPPSWAIWAWLIYLIGSRWLPEAATSADTGELLRTVGFASSPGLLRIFGLVPVLGVDANMIHGWPPTPAALTACLRVGRLYATTLSEGASRFIPIYAPMLSVAPASVTLARFYSDVRSGSG